MVGEAGEVAPWVSLFLAERVVGGISVFGRRKDGELERELRMRALG
jgi:hypothetical protein